MDAKSQASPTTAVVRRQRLKLRGHLRSSAGQRSQRSWPKGGLWQSLIDGLYAVDAKVEILAVISKTAGGRFALYETMNCSEINRTNGKQPLSAIHTQT